MRPSDSPRRRGSLAGSLSEYELLGWMDKMSRKLDAVLLFLQ